MSEEQRRLIEHHAQMALEGYRDLSSWNNRDNQILSSFDKILLPVIIGGWALSFVKFPEHFTFVYIGSVLLLTHWIWLSCRIRERNSERFSIMRKIEHRLGFKAHLLITDTLNTPRDVTLRITFYAATMFLGLVVAGMTPSKLKLILDCSLWNRCLVLSPFFVIIVVTTILLLAKTSK